MTTLLTTSLDKLSTLGLVTLEQHDAILAHPDYAAFAQLGKPDQQLLWAYRQGLISHQEIDAMTTLEETERDRIVDTVNEQIADEICTHHRLLLDQLLMLGLITDEQREEAAPENYMWRLDSAADMLVALYEDHVVPAQDIAGLRERIKAERHLIDGARRMQIVEQVHRRLAADPEYARHMATPAQAPPVSDRVLLVIGFLCYWMLLVEEWPAVGIGLLGVWMMGGHRGLLNLLFCALVWYSFFWP